jgi:protein AFG1
MSFDCWLKYFHASDYRRIPRALSNVYFHPLTPENHREVDKIFRSLTSKNPDDPVIRNRSIETWGRIVLVPQSTTKIARFKFEDLCGKPLSAGDYIELTKTFGTIFLIGVPKMGLDKKDLVSCFDHVVGLARTDCVVSFTGETVYYLY